MIGVPPVKRKSPMKFALGQSIQRLEDEPLLRGAGRYTDDFALKKAAHVIFVRSPHAHARVEKISVEEARKAPGVLAILTGKDVKADGLGNIPCLIPVPGLKETPRPILALETVKHVGDPVAMVIAETLQQAKDAAEQVEVDYTPLRPVTEAKDGEVLFEVGLGESKAKVDAALAKAAHLTRLELINNRLVANPIEPRAALAEYDAASGRTTLYTPSQGPHHLYGQIADVILKAPREQIRVVSGNVGGAFGMKIFLYPEQPAVVWAARRLKRSVRWTAERSEAFLSDAQGRDNYSLAELATDNDGRFLALRVTTWAAMGGYLSNFGPFIPQLAAPMLSGVYRIPAIHLNIKGTLTHTVPVDAYRGAGRPEAIYLLERTIDVAARELGIAPEELRRRNFIKPSEMPYQTPVESRYDSGDFAAVMEKAMQKAQWQGFAQRKISSGKKRGLGMAMYIERCGGGPGDTVRLQVKANEVVLYSGMQDNGQGHTTTFVQLLSQKLGIDAGKIKVVQGDTDLVPGDGLTGGSRFLAVAGVAAGGAADEVIEQGKEEAARRLEAAAADIEYRDGEFRIAGTDRRIGLFELGALEATHTRAPEHYTYPNGCHICELEVDPQTGATTIVRYTVVDDFGRAMNPKLLEGQVQGGTVQGIGQALLEHAVYDPQSGQLLSGSFMDYAMPRAGDLPSFDCGFHHVPCTTNPLGVKGAGEAGAVGAPAAVVNALANALGVRHLDMPLTPEKVWRALTTAQRS
jgi:aerobic carbon-monoxide dehydrogenase large subunit